MIPPNFTDYLAITNLLALYCSLYDAGDYEGYSRLFTHGRVIGPDGSVREGPAAVLQHHQDHSTLYEDGTPRTAHVNSNIRIDFAEDELTATASSYVTVFQALEDFPLQPIASGRYEDRLEKIEGVWWFRERRAVIDFWGDQRKHQH